MRKNIIIAILSIVLVILLIKITWNPTDLGWICALGGAIITGLITWFAVYETSKLDRKARVYEFKYKHFIENLSQLKENIIPIDRLTFCFKKDKQCIMSFSVDNDYLSKEYEIRKFIKQYKYLCKINNSFKIKTSEMDNIFESFADIYKFFNQQIFAHKHYIETAKEDFKRDFIRACSNDGVKYCIDEFLTCYKDNTSIDYDVTEMNNDLRKLYNIIEEEFKLEDK